MHVHIVLYILRGAALGSSVSAGWPWLEDTRISQHVSSFCSYRQGEIRSPRAAVALLMYCAALTDTLSKIPVAAGHTRTSLNFWRKGRRRMVDLNLVEKMGKLGGIVTVLSCNGRGLSDRGRVSRVERMSSLLAGNADLAPPPYLVADSAYLW